MFQLFDVETGAVVVPELDVAGSFGPRAARGLLGRDALAPAAGLLLSDPLHCIHTVGMRFAIDIVFLDRELVVVAVAEGVRPWRFRWHRRGRHQLEVAAGSALGRGLAPGRRVRVRAQVDHDGGPMAPESPHAPLGNGGTAHRTANPGCGFPPDVPTVPPSAGSTDGIDHISGRSTPCARSC